MKIKEQEDWIESLIAFVNMPPDERYRVQPDLFGTLSIIPVGDAPMVVFTDKHLSECYVLDEAKDEK